MSDEQERVDDIVIFGAGQMGTTIARVLLDRDIRVRFVEGRAERAREVAEELPEARVFHASRVRPRVLRARADRAAPPPRCSRSTTIPATCSARSWPRPTACS